MLKIGDRVPDLEMTDHKGETFKLRDRAAQGPVVFYFYPKDFTRICTEQACMFRDAHEEMQGLGAQVIGVSVDGTTSHKRFAEEHQLPFSLVPDPDRRIATAFGVFQLFGLLTKRATFVIDREGVVRGVFHHEFSAQKHLKDVRALLDTLK